MTEGTAELLAKVTPQIALSVQEQLVQLFTARGRRVIVIAGPTGVGKTTLSLDLAQKLKGEIISADSMQVYRGMDIGTAKVSKEEQKEIPHHLINICNITESFNAHDYFVQATQAIEQIFARNNVPMVVGGTGFYLHTLLYGPPSGPPSNPDIRKALEHEADRFGIDLLFDRLESLDPTYAASITRNDNHKIIRALEIIHLSGQPVSNFSWKQRPLLPTYDFRCWFLYRSRDKLYERLDRRCEEMISQGLLEEVKRLDHAGIRKNPTARQAIGYRQTLEYLETSQSPEEYSRYIERFKQSSRHLAKRQFTWFKKELLFRWLNMAEFPPQEALDIILQEYSLEG